jgi:hypothetical protein
MLSELSGKGWTFVEPPERLDEESVLARYDGEPIKGGVLVEKLEDKPDLIHSLYRTGPYDVEVKIDFSIGRGSVKVEKAEGYNYENNDEDE